MSYEAASTTIGDSSAHLSFSKRKPGLPTRGALVLGMGLVFLFATTATPIYVYYANPWKEHNNSASNRASSCNSSHEISLSVLNRSMCRSHFPKWSRKPDPENSSSRNVSVSGCGDFSKVNELLKKFPRYAPFIGVDSHCVGKLMEPLCHYAFDDCGSGGPSRSSVTRQLCLTVDNVAQCKPIKKLWSTITSYSFIKCLDIPNCEKYWNSSQKNAFVSPTSSDSDSQNSSCPSPLVKTSGSTHFRYYQKCSPPCRQSAWKTPISSAGYQSATIATVAFGWLSLSIVVFTWCKVRKLFTYETMSGFFIAIAFLIFMVAPAIPLFATPERTYCKHKDLIGSWEDPTTLCNIQGLLGHFGYIWSLMWWLISIYNTLIVVWKFPLETDRARRKLTFFIQFVLSIVLPSALVTTSLKVGGSYSSTSVFTIMCSPPTLSLMFHTFILPGSVIILIGTVMSAFIIYRLHKAKIFHRGLGEKFKKMPVYKAYQLIQKRFFLQSLLMPLCFSFIMATITIYLRTDANIKIIRSYYEYAVCVNAEPKSKSNAIECREKMLDVSAVTIAIVDLFLADVYIFALATYCLMWAEARKFWSRTWRRFRRCLGRCSKINLPETSGNSSTTTTEESTPLNTTT